MKGKQKRRTTLTVEPDVLEYLDEVAQQIERSRGWVLCAIVREHAKRQKNGQPDPKPLDPSYDLTESYKTQAHAQ